MRIGVGIATSGRPTILREVLHELTLQCRLPDQVIVCPSCATDVVENTFEGVNYASKIVRSEPGLTKQRNAILKASEELDLMVFFDDDFLPAQNYLANVDILFTREPTVLSATGVLIADGITGPGLSVRQAKLMMQDPRASGYRGKVTPYHAAYGCNMAIRLAPVRQHGILFDEVLELYAWLEDIDFSRRLAEFGKIVRAEPLTGVHLGVKSGRGSGIKLGYSQVANPIYLVNKGTVRMGFGTFRILKNFGANLAHCLIQEPYIDRRGRLKGNLMALADLWNGKLHPSRIATIEGQTTLSERPQSTDFP